MFQGYPEDMSKRIHSYLLKRKIPQPVVTKATAWYCNGRVYVHSTPRDCYVIDCGSCDLDEQGEVKQVSMIEFDQLMQVIRKEWWGGKL